MLWENLQNALEQLGSEIAEAYKEALLRDDKRATGDLINSIKYQVEKNGSSYEVELNLEWYWKIIEEGVNGTEINNGSPYSFKVKKIPVAPIYDWIKVKNILPRPMTITRSWTLKDGTVRTRQEQILPTQEQLAHAMAYSIPRKGFIPGHQLRDVISSINDRVDEVLEEAIYKDVDAAIDFMFG